jgi:hypothetical protein
MALPYVALGTLDSFQHGLNISELDEHHNIQQDTWIHRKTCVI